MEKVSDKTKMKGENFLKKKQIRRTGVSFLNLNVPELACRAFSQL